MDNGLSETRKRGKGQNKENMELENTKIKAQGTFTHIVTHSDNVTGNHSFSVKAVDMSSSDYWRLDAGVSSNTRKLRKVSLNANL